MPSDSATVPAACIENADSDSAAVNEAPYSMVDEMNARLDKLAEKLRTIMDVVCAQKGPQEPETMDQSSPGSGQDSS